MTRLRILLFLGVLGSLGASHRTDHFVVQAADEEIASQVGEAAETCWKDLALLWLGREMSDWQEPVLLRVTPTGNGMSGATTFAFDRGVILGVEMHVEGSLEQILETVLPHEVAHVVLAYYFRRPVPRWADEGSAVLGERPSVRMRYARLMSSILDREDRYISLRDLFRTKGYPRDVLALYAEGHSISQFLVESRTRKTFLAFVSDGMEGEWDKACRKHYDFKNVEEMEAAWLKWARANKPSRERELRRTRTLEAEVKLLKLEKKLLQLQLAKERQEAEWQKEKDRLETAIEGARKTLERLRQDSRTPPEPATPERTEKPPRTAVPVPVDIESVPTVPPKRD